MRIWPTTAANPYCFLFNMSGSSWDKGQHYQVCDDCDSVRFVILMTILMTYCVIIYCINFRYSVGDYSDTCISSLVSVFIN